jgi:hypothetical protein
MEINNDKEFENTETKKLQEPSQELKKVIPENDTSIAKKKIEADKFILEKEIDSKYDLQLKEHEYKVRVFKEGMEYGSKSVLWAFVVIFLVYVVSIVTFHWLGKSFMEPTHFLILIGILALSLLVYHAFIFGYSIYMTMDSKEGKASLTVVKPLSQEQSDKNK